MLTNKNLKVHHNNLSAVHNDDNKHKYLNTTAIQSRNAITCLSFYKKVGIRIRSLKNYLNFKKHYSCAANNCKELVTYFFCVNCMSKILFGCRKRKQLTIILP